MRQQRAMRLRACLVLLCRKSHPRIVPIVRFPVRQLGNLRTMNSRHDHEVGRRKQLDGTNQLISDTGVVQIRQQDHQAAMLQQAANPHGGGERI